MSQFEPSPQAEEENESRLRADAEDSMQLKRERLGMTDDVVAQQQTPAAEDTVDDARLSYVDRLLKSAPMLKAPLGLADRVITRLKEETPLPPGYDSGIGVAAGLGVAALITLPIMATLAVVLVRSVLYEDVRRQTWQTFSGFVGDAWAWLIDLPPVFLVVLAIVAVIYLLFSGYLVWFWRGLIRTARSLK